ncbi:MAG: hypothetical protein ACE5F1_21210, partial [Planctomycetota bacterium]
PGILGVTVPATASRGLSADLRIIVPGCQEGGETRIARREDGRLVLGAPEWRLADVRRRT